MLELEEDLYLRLKEVLQEFKIQDLSLEIETPRSSKYGDLSSNIALKLSARLKKKPEQIAQLVIEKLRPLYVQEMEKIEYMPPGFINFHLSWNFLHSFLFSLLEEGESCLRNNLGKGRRILLEFVSANPSGPLSIAHARQAAIGLSLAKILEFSGYRVEKEYYINDEGTQIELLGCSLKVRCLQLLGEKAELPAEGYQGQYLVDLARKLIQQEGLSLEKIQALEDEFFINYAVENILEEIRNELLEFGIEYDFWTSQKKLRLEGKIEQALAQLESSGLLYQKEGALWFRSSRFGDEQDRVVKRADQRYTYFAADIAYHREKFERGYDLLIDLWGPDHHGYIARVMAAMQALGYQKEKLKVLLVQLATLYQKGKPIALSTRKGQILTLGEVVAQIGRDATLYFLLTRKIDSHLDFDLDLAKKHSLENPVYYIQYAHARISSLLSFAQEKGYNLDKLPEREELRNLNQEEEKLLLRTLIQLPRIIKVIALTQEPSLLTSYLLELAGRFHSYYNKYRIVEEGNPHTPARLYLCKGLKIAFSKGLFLLGISAPEKM